MKSIDYIELLQERYGWNNTEVAAQLGLARQAASNYRYNNVEMSDKAAIKVAELLDIPPLKVLADIHCARERDPKVKSVWLKIASGSIVLSFSCILVSQHVVITDFSYAETVSHSIDYAQLYC